MRQGHFLRELELGILAVGLPCASKALNISIRTWQEEKEKDDNPSIYKKILYHFSMFDSIFKKILFHI